MPVFRSYSKSEEAYSDAAFLCSMAIDASVVDERAFGGNLLGTSTEGIRIELPEEQLTKAHQLLSDRDFDHSVPIESDSTKHASTSLERLLRGALCFDLSCYVLFLVGIKPPSQPPAVEQFLRSLVLSDALWRLVYASIWPLVVGGIIANILCLFYNRLGRSLFALMTILSIASQLGPPPQIYGPLLGFILGLQGASTIIALSLMYWSPIHERFHR